MAVSQSYHGGVNPNAITAATPGLQDTSMTSNGGVSQSALGTNSTIIKDEMSIDRGNGGGGSPGPHNVQAHHIISHQNNRRQSHPMANANGPSSKSPHLITSHNQYSQVGPQPQKSKNQAGLVMSSVNASGAAGNIMVMHQNQMQQLNNSRHVRDSVKDFQAAQQFSLAIITNSITS